MNNTKLQHLETAVSLFSQLSLGNFPVHHAQLFLLVAMAGEKGATYVTLSEQTGLSSAAISRSMNALSDHVRHRQDAMGLVKIERDPQGSRAYRVTLSPRGKALAIALEGVL